MKLRTLVITATIVCLLPATARADGCAEPLGAFARTTAADARFDAAKLQAAVDLAMTRGTTRNFNVYRHGCLVAGAALPGTDDLPNESFSVAKSVTSLLVGRAAHLGLLSVDDRVGDHFEGSGFHGPISMRHLLMQSSGVHWNFFRDYFLATDRIKDFFALELDHQPGTWFEYAQTPITVLAEIVTRAAGEDVQTFAQRELFGKLGVAEGSWTWTRDPAGHTAGYYGLNMRHTDFARFGELMRRGGVWNGERLIGEDFLAASVTPSATNPVYGYLWWLNGSELGVAPTIYGRDNRFARPIASAPHDLYMAAGYADQRIWVVPSLDLVVTRFGNQSNREADTRASVWTSDSGEFEHNLWRMLGEAFLDPDDRARFDLDAIYSSPETVPAIDPGYSIIGSLLEPDVIAEGLLTIAN